MSAKTDYSTNVEKRRIEAQTNDDLARAWAAGRDEHDRYISSMRVVDINDLVWKDYSPSEVRMYPRKVIFPSVFGPEFEVVADLSGGYLRIQKRGTRTYLTLEGRAVMDETKQSMCGKTHFRIAKPGEKQ